MTVAEEYRDNSYATQAGMPPSFNMPDQAAVDAAAESGVLGVLERQEQPADRLVYQQGARHAHAGVGETMPRHVHIHAEPDRLMRPSPPPA